MKYLKCSVCSAKGNREIVMVKSLPMRSVNIKREKIKGAVATLMLTAGYFVSSIIDCIQ